jgi:hypothetical protein
MLPLPCMLVCTFVCANRTRDRGCSKHPVFPAPSNFEEGNEDANLGRLVPRECKSSFSRHCERSEAIHLSACRAMDCFAPLAMTWRESCHTGSAIEYFTWLSAKLDSIEAMPSSRVSLFFRNAS